MSSISDRNVMLFPDRAVGAVATIYFAQKKITLGGLIVNQTEADELIAAILALREMLPVTRPVRSAVEE